MEVGPAGQRGREDEKEGEVVSTARGQREIAERGLDTGSQREAKARALSDRNARVVKMAREGLPYAAIRERTGLTRPTIRKICAEAGVSPVLGCPQLVIQMGSEEPHELEAALDSLAALHNQQALILYALEEMQRLLRIGLRKEHGSVRVDKDGVCGDSVCRVCGEP